MSQLITINSGQCGSGKTQNDIIPRIQQNYINGVKTLIIGPGINYQKQLQRDLAKGKLPIYATVINSEVVSPDTVSTQLNQAMICGDEVIIATSQAFLLTPWYKSTQYELIIDEAFDIFKKVEFKHKNTSTWTVDFRFDQLFGLNQYHTALTCADPENEDSFIKLERNFHYGDNLFSDSTNFRTLMNKNYDVYTTPRTYNKLINQEDDGKLSFYLMLKDEIFALFNSVHIASARFESTFLYYLLSKKYKLETNVPFVPHRINGKIHTYKSEYNFKISKNKIVKHPELIDNMLSYAASLDDKCLLLANNNVKTPSGFIRLTHNCHGMNTPEMMETTTVAILSAIVMSPDLKKFVKELLLEQETGDLDKIIERAHFINTAYQSILRNKIRTREYNEEEINIVVMDENIGSLLVEYFDFIDINNAVVEIALPTSFTAAPKKSMSPEEVKESKKKRNAAYYQKIKTKGLKSTSKANCLKNISDDAFGASKLLPAGRNLPLTNKLIASSSQNTKGTCSRVTHRCRPDVKNLKKPLDTIQQF